MRIPPRLGLSVLCLLGFATACWHGTEVCMSLPRRGIVLEVVDRGTGQDLAPRATVSIKQLQAPFDSAMGPITNPNADPLTIANGRVGRYRLSVEVPGYQRWSTEAAVETEVGRCGSNLTTRVRAELMRAP